MKKLTNKRGLGLSSSKGFTLIEVVLVLAIGGLIFLLAFIAFQQVSANRRDTQRRSDAGRVLAELENYYGDKNKYPNSSVAEETCATPTADSFGAFMGTYLCKSGTFDGPQGAYTIVAGVATPNTALAVNNIRFNSTVNCDATAGKSVQIGLEKGVACRDSK